MSLRNILVSDSDELITESTEPTSLILPKDLHAFTALLEAQPDDYWIAKPTQNTASSSHKLFNRV